MNSKVKFLTISGTYVPMEEFQRRYGLPVGSPQIGKFFSIEERVFSQDIERYGQLIVPVPLIMVMDEFRKRVGSVPINSFNRDEAKQAELTKQGFRTASVSPHIEKLAVDMDTTDANQTKKRVPILSQVGKDLNIQIRIGWAQYMTAGQSFIHLDVCPEYFGPGKIWHARPHPQAWEKQIQW